MKSKVKKELSVMQFNNSGQLMKILQKTSICYKICRHLEINTDFYFPIIS